MELHRIKINEDAMVTIEYIDKNDVIHCDTIDVTIREDNSLNIEKWHDYTHEEE